MSSDSHLRAAIFDVDGVLVDSPHERAWRETLDSLMAGPWADLADEIGYEPGALTSALYQSAVAGRPRMDGARAGLVAGGLADPADDQVSEYAAAKQTMLVELIERDPPKAFDDAVTLLMGLRAAGLHIATASSSENAGALLSAINLPSGRPIRDVLDAEISGLSGPGKPDPAIFLEAVRRLGFSPAECFVIEDAPAGIEAARRGGMTCVGIDRGGEGQELRDHGATVVLERLDAMSAPELLAALGAHS